MAFRNDRKRMTQVAVLAFVAADCAGVAYVQHRMARKAEAIQEMAYAQPLNLPAASAPVLAFAPIAPAADVAAPAAAPAAAPVRHDAPALVRAVAQPAPVQVALAPRAEEKAPVVRHAKLAANPSAADSAFASAFSLDGEAPDSEQRFGQGAGASGTGSLADLVVPREEPAPLFDRAGIAPVTGEAAAVDGPAPTVPDLPATAPAAEELPATKG